MQQCYYEVLDVDRKATPDELKKAFRKKAMRWHPDRNPKDIDAATAQFKLIQNAYAVLNDPHERSWYDSHRDSILKGLDPDEMAQENEGVNLWPYFNDSCYYGFNDSAKGFYTVYRDLFDTIVKEDLVAYFGSDWQHPPGFGKADTPYVPAIQNFYAHWVNYTTTKTFAWMDQWNPAQAPSRQHRRFIEQENKKERDKARSKHVEAVRNLVLYVKKRDKRYLTHVKKEQEAREARDAEYREKKRKEDAERRKKIDDYVKAHKEAIDAGDISADEFDEDLFEDLMESININKKTEEEEEVDPEELFCPACDRQFRKLLQFKDHQQTKKHQQNVRKLQKEMEEDDDFFKSMTSPEPEKKSRRKKKKKCDPLDDLEDDDEDIYAPEIPQEISDTISSLKSRRKKRKQKLFVAEPEPTLPQYEVVESPVADPESEETVHSKEDVEGDENDNDVKDETPTEEPAAKKKAKKAKKEPVVEPAPAEDDWSDGERKRKSKKAKRKAKADVPAWDCKICNDSFETRNQLFKHIQATGHAALKTSAPTKAKRR